MSRFNSNLFNSDQNSNIQFESRSNMKNYNTAPIKALLDNAKSALVVAPQTNVDSIGAALALALSLKKKGLDVKVFSSQKTDSNYSKLSGLELLIDSLNVNDLVVSLDYPVDQIEQVSYNDDGGRLNLVVKTKAGAPKVESNQIIVNNQSSAADICFMLGDEASLGINTSIVNKGNWVFISPVQVNKAWAKASLVDPDAPYSEIFTFLLPMLGLTLDLDSGKNLLIGLRVATQSFSVNVSPETFEAGAVCLRATQPEDDFAPPINTSTPIENIEKTGNLIPGTNKANPNPTI